MRLFIEPNESLLFRTGRPFVAGENNFAETLFPPTPETLQGAIRATIAAYWRPGMTIAEAFQQTELVNLIGDRKGYGRFRITGIALGRRERNAPEGAIERLFPAPAYLLEDEESKKQARLVLRSPEDTGIVTNLPANMSLLYTTEDAKDANAQDKQEKATRKDDKLEPTKGWLTESDLYNVLHPNEHGNDYQASIIHDKDIFTRESRMGIGMNYKTKATEEGLLYQVEMIRMNHKVDAKHTYGFVVDIGLATEASVTRPIDEQETREKLKCLKGGWMNLGGERRAARFEVITSPESSPFEQNTQGNMLYLATPAAFNYGWQPGDWQTSHIEKPVAVAIERYQPIGGWSLTPENAGGNDKPLRRCVPAGTVYFFSRAISIPSFFTEHGQEIGYGIAYAGNTGVN